MHANILLTGFGGDVCTRVSSTKYISFSPIPEGIVDFTHGESGMVRPRYTTMITERC